MLICFSVFFLIGILSSWHLGFDKFLCVHFIHDTSKWLHADLQRQMNVLLNHSSGIRQLLSSPMPNCLSYFRSTVTVSLAYSVGGIILFYRGKNENRNSEKLNWKSKICRANCQSVLIHCKVSIKRTFALTVTA